MDNRHLRHFLAVVDQGGVTRAAAYLRIAQPSLSQSLKVLERELGVPLFHRVGRTVVLSSAGRSLLGPARAAVRHMDSVRQSAAALSEGRGGHVDLVSMPTPALEPLSSLVGAFHREHPGHTVAVSAAFTQEQVINAVLSGAAELGLAASEGESRHADLKTVKLSEQALVLVLDPTVSGNEFPQSVTVAPGELDGHSMVVSQPGSLMRSVVDGWISDGVGIHVAVEMDHRSSILTMVAAGVGHALLPSAWASTAHRLGLGTRRIHGTPRLGITLMARQDDLTPAAQTLLALAESMPVTNDQGT